MTTKEKKRIEIDIDTYMDLVKIGKNVLKDNVNANCTPNAFASAALNQILEEWKNGGDDRIQIDTETNSSLLILESAGMGNRHELASRAIRDFVARHKDEALKKISQKLGV